MRRAVPQTLPLAKPFTVVGGENNNAVVEQTAVTPVREKLRENGVDLVDLTGVQGTHGSNVLG